MKTDIEVLKFGVADEFYAIAEIQTICEDKNTDPGRLHIFEVEGANGRPPKEIHVSTRASIVKLRNFLNSLYDSNPSKVHEVECPLCIENRMMRGMLQDVAKIFKGLEANRLDSGNSCHVSLSKDAILYNNIQKLKFTIDNLLEPQE